ncbi:hypothetical protein E1A91_D03G081700v1 [Gossypium mustelinum]|uniref:Uncharacterized protein n=1 Tax=Gossypium mustelinum TaxID=34275 RepID=A0A5D2VKZ0_GOSMU|nr:hypothetical protein E1A91_D03G081700v1 [Gossypium mustelinum]
MYSPIVNLSLSVFQAFLITFKESLSISAWVIPQSLPTVTACTQVMAFAAKTEEQSRKMCSLISNPCMHLGQIASVVNLFVRRFTRVGR